MDSAPDLPPVVAYMQFVKETATHAKVKEDFELYMNDAKQCVGYLENPAVAFPLTLSRSFMIVSCLQDLQTVCETALTSCSILLSADSAEDQTRYAELKTRFEKLRAEKK